MTVRAALTISTGCATPILYARLLARLIDIWTPVLHRTIPGLPDDQVAALHDPLTIACLVEPDMVAIERMSVTVATHGGLARTLLDPFGGRSVEVVRAVGAVRFAAFWLATVT